MERVNVMDILVFQPGHAVEKWQLPYGSREIRLPGERGAPETALPIAYAAHEGRAYAVAGPFKWPELVKAITSLAPEAWRYRT